MKKFLIKKSFLDCSLERYSGYKSKCSISKKSKVSEYFSGLVIFLVLSTEKECYMLQNFLFFRSYKETVVFHVKSKEMGLTREIAAKKDENLGKILQNAGIPLPFTCNCNCECATCAVRFANRRDFVEISILQPLSNDEAHALRENGKSNL